jgi:hypothetical protein
MHIVRYRSLGLQAESWMLSYTVIIVASVSILTLLSNEAACTMDACWTDAARRENLTLTAIMSSWLGLGIDPDPPASVSSVGLAQSYKQIDAGRLLMMTKAVFTRLDDGSDKLSCLHSLQQRLV